MTTWPQAPAPQCGDPFADPYRRLGVAPTVSDAELRRAYRRLVQLHHPDHNGGAVVVAVEQFTAIQRAYHEAVRLRNVARRPRPTATEHAAWGETIAPGELPDPLGGELPDPLDGELPDPLDGELGAGRRPWAEPWLDDRIAAFERQFAERRLAQEAAYRAATGHEPGPAPRYRQEVRRRMAEWLRDG